MSPDAAFLVLVLLLIPVGVVGFLLGRASGERE